LWRYINQHCSLGNTAGFRVIFLQPDPGEIDLCVGSIANIFFGIASPRIFTAFSLETALF